MTTPNLLTLIRIALVWPLYVCILHNQDWMALGIYAFGLLTDILDGRIARATNSTSAFGRAMDSASDKTLVAAAMVGLVARQSLTPTICFAFLFRELMILGLRAIKTQENQTVGEINDRLGRIRFTVLHAGLISLLAPVPTIHGPATMAVAASLIMAYLVLAYYIFDSRRLLVASMSS